MNGLQLAPATVVRSLISAGRLIAATDVARRLLTGQLSRDDAGEVRSALVTALAMSAKRTQAIAEADHLLASDELPAALAGTVSATRLIVLAGSDSERAEQLACSLLRGSSPRTLDARPAGLRATGLAVLAIARWRRGQLTDALAMAQAAGHAGETTAPFGSDAALAPSRSFPLAVLVDKLATLGNFAEAERVLRHLADGVAGFDQGPNCVVTTVMQARVHARAGRLAPAFERAKHAVALAEWAEARSLIPFSKLVLAGVATRLGYLDTAATALAGARALRLSAVAELRARQAIAELHLIEATDGPLAAGTRLSAEFAWLAGAPVALSSGPTTVAWLTRLALAAGHDQLARQAVRAIRHLAIINPELAVIQTAATHAEAVLCADAEVLSQVAAEHADPWSRARALEDRAEALAGQTPSTGRRAVVDAWGRTLAGYQEIGAHGDEMRIEATLRLLGCRQRGRQDHPSDSGWPQLTGQEAAVAELVAQGMTNQGAARRLHLSPHTVNFHLRAIFRKLGIQSRVELAHLHGEASPRTRRTHEPIRRTGADCQGDLPERIVHRPHR